MIGPILTHLQIKEVVFSIVWSMNFKFIGLIKKLTVINQNNKIIFRLTVQIVVTLPWRKLFAQLTQVVILAVSGKHSQDNNNCEERDC